MVRSLLLSLASIVLVAAPASARAPALIDCPLRDAPFSIDAPLVDVLLDDRAKQLAAPVFDKLITRFPPDLLHTTAPTFAAIMTLRQAAEIGGMDPLVLPAIDTQLRTLPVTAADKGAEAGHEFCLTFVKVASADRCGEFGLFGEPQRGQSVPRRRRRPVEQFAFHDPQCVRRHERVEVHRSGGGGPHIALEEFRDGGDQFSRRGPSGEGAHDVRSNRSRMSHSFSQTRRPMAASSTDRVCPDRWRSA